MTSFSISSILPREFLEPNLRLYSFIVLIIASILALVSFPVAPFKGYIDPFYSPTVIILPLVGLFRLTCYAYRKDYNRHVFKHPVACPAYEREDSKGRKYQGETSALFRAENYHRYFMYAAVVILPFFYYDLYVSLMYGGAFILRFGSLLIAANAVSLTLYTLSCHAVRNLVGGRNDCFSCMKLAKQRKGAYDLQSALNRHHEKLAWISLFIIVAVDLYIRALTMGIGLDFVI